MMQESSIYDKKSLLTFAAEPARWDWAKIAKHCVAFANARGGMLVFGKQEGTIESSGTHRHTRYSIAQKGGK